MYNFQNMSYYSINSDIHKMNPIYKIICMIIFLLLLLSNNILFLTILILFIISLLILSKIPLKKYIKNIVYILPFIVCIVIINIVFKIELIVSLKSIMKLISILWYSNLLIYTTKPNDITYALEKIFYPLKIFGVPVKSLSLSLSLSIRFIPTIFEQSKKVLKSQLSRGLYFNNNIKENINKLFSILIPTFKLSFKRSEEIANTLDMKLYVSNKKSTKYKSFTFSSSDDNIIFMHILLIFICVVLEVLL